MNFHIFLILSIVISFTNGYKVLVMGPFNGKSHFLYIKSFVLALLERGHDVTFLTSNSMSSSNLVNYTEVLIDPPFDIFSLVPQEKMMDMTESSPFSTINDMSTFTTIFNSHAFESANVQKFIHSTGLHFDVIVNEEFFADSFLMFSHKFKAPIVTICPFGISHHVDYQMGLLTPLSIAAHWMLPYSDNMTFLQRWYNTIVSTYESIMRKYMYIPNEEELTKKYFAHLAPLPTMNELLNNISVTLVNTHRALSPPRVSMPGTVPIGGAHVHPAKPLPNDLQKFLDEAKHGAIYFSLGTVIKSSKLPKEKIMAFLDAFRPLKQRVLWKFEDETLTDIPPNVMIRKWMPQNDILAHPNVILFISHGGLFGTSESLYHGVPLLLIPFFGDQHRNAYRIELAGYGKFIAFVEITKETLSKKIEEITSNESFLTKAKRASAIFKDNLVHPMDEAMFWIEHVAKFKGAKHLKSHAVNMSWFSYLLLDVIFVNILGASAVLYACYYLVKKLFSKKKNVQKNTKKEQ